MKYILKENFILTEEVDFITPIVNSMPSDIRAGDKID